MDHLSQVPTDVLRQIPNCYRIWQLLRLASKAIHSRLGDYHAYKDMITWCDAQCIDYQSFSSQVVRNLRNPGSTQSVLTIYQNCSLALGPRAGFEAPFIINIMNVITFYDADGYELFQFRLKCAPRTYFDQVLYVVGQINDIPYEIRPECSYPRELAMRKIYEDLPEICSAITLSGDEKWVDII